MNIENDKFILDPLSVIIKLAILSKKEVGSKISIYNNILYIQDLGVFQPLIRYIFKNNKIDIPYIYNPIYYACNHFLSESIIKSNPNIKKIFINAQKGLELLIATYKEHTIITHTLNYYNYIIESHLSGKVDDKLFVKDSYSEFYNSSILKSLNSIWNNEKIKIVLNLIEFINNEKESNKNVKCLEEFMTLIDENVKNIFVNHVPQELNKS